MNADKFTVDDLAAMLRGCTAILDTLAKVFPGASPEELVEKAREIGQGGAALELLHTVLIDRKLRIGA